MTRTIPGVLPRWLWRAVVTATVVALLLPVLAAVLLALLAWLGAAVTLSSHPRRFRMIVLPAGAATVALALGAPSQPALVYAAPIGLCIGWLDIFFDRIARNPAQRVDSDDPPALVVGSGVPPNNSKE